MTFWFRPGYSDGDDGGGTELYVRIGDPNSNALRHAYGTSADRSKIVPMHCVTAYPADLDECHLRSHPRLVYDTWGLSDHTTHPTIAPCAAVALGASVIEKHLRLHDSIQIDRDFDRPYATPLQPEGTPDVGHSLDPSEFREMVEAIRLTEKVLGSSEKRIRESERPYLKYRRGPRGLRGA